MHTVANARNELSSANERNEEKMCHRQTHKLAEWLQGKSICSSLGPFALRRAHWSARQRKRPPKRSSPSQSLQLWEATAIVVTI